MAYFRPISDRTQTWWALAIGGIASILFGLTALLWPGLTLLVLVALFGAYTLVHGLAETAAMVRAMREHRTWWTYLLIGLINVAAGVVVLAYPGISALVLVYVIGFWAVAIGVTEVVAAFATGEFLVVIAGVISILFGFLLLANPLAGALSYVMVIGLFALVRGILLLVASVVAPSVAPTG